MTSKILRIILVLLLTFQGLPLNLTFKGNSINLGIKQAQAQTTGWLSGYSYRKAVVIDNTSGSAQTDYQVKVTNPIYDETGLKGSWHMDGTVGAIATGAIVADSSGNSNNGTASNANGSGMAYATGKHDQGINFDGTDDYVSVSHSTSLNITTGVTISGWIKAASFAATGGVYPRLGEKTTAYGILFDPTTNKANGRLHIGASAYTYSGTTVLSLTTWYHVAMTYDGSQVKIYVNGTLDASPFSQTGSIDSNTNNFFIGSYGGSAGFFNGLIDEVRIYNRALSASEIKAHYEAKAKLNYGDVRFTDSDGTTELTTAGQGNYWMEKDGTFWVKVPSISASSTKTIYMYYGKSDASQIYNGSATFEFFDDFETDTESTYTISGTDLWSISNGKLNFSGDGVAGNRIIYKALPSGVSDNYAIEANYNGVSIGGYSNSQSAIYASNTAPGSKYGFERIEVGTTEQWGLYMLSGEFMEADDDTHFLNQSMVLSFTMNGNTKRGLKDYSQVTTHSGTYIPAYFGFGHYFGNVATIEWDNLRIRKYASTEPAVTGAGTEESFNLKANYWQYRMPVTITNGGSAQYNYQVSVTVDTATPITAGHMNSDCSDIRFSSTNDYDEEDWSISYPYWIESGANSATTKIWVKIDSIAGTPTTTTIYLYYGNQGALSASSGTNTFVFFDGFDTSLDTTNKWTTTGGAGSYSVSGGELTLTNQKYIASANTYTGGYAFREKFKLGTDTSGNVWGGI